MSADDAMTINERRKYLTKMQSRYRQADRHARGALLTEMEAVTGMHRKSLTRLMAQSTLKRVRRRTERGTVYGPDVRRIVRLVWESLDCICAERLTPQLLTTARHLATFGEIVLTATVAEQLETISEATVTRILRGMPRALPRLPRKGPAQANRVLRDVPMGRIPWQTTTPGWCEVDLVHHCGESAAGEYVHTCNSSMSPQAGASGRRCSDVARRRWKRASGASSPICPSPSSICIPTMAVSSSTIISCGSSGRKSPA
jgi:hypothetical protein